jgi:hypothetical protein
MAPSKSFYEFKKWLAENRIGNLKQLAFGLMDLGVEYYFEVLKKGKGQVESITVLRKGYKIQVVPADECNLLFHINVKVDNTIHFAGAM